MAEREPVVDEGLSEAAILCWLLFACVFDCFACVLVIRALLSI